MRDAICAFGDSFCSISLSVQFSSLVCLALVDKACAERRASQGLIYILFPLLQRKYKI